MSRLVDRLFEAHLTVRNLDRSIEFYRDRLGLEMAHVERARHAAFFWVGSRGRGMLGLWEGQASAAQPVSHIALATTVATVVAAPATLERAGITPLDFDGLPSTEPVVLAWMPAVSVYFRDPDGHLLEFIAMLDGEGRPDRGVVSWREWTESRLPAAVRTAQPRVLAISGSLRAASSNSALVEAASRLASGVDVSVYRELGDLPPFNPDADVDAIPAVGRFRAVLDSSDAVLISSPEYAHGVPGVLKNALDWIVGTGELIDKPVAIVNTSARATHAYASLKETLTTMSARVVEDASTLVALDGRSRDATAILRDSRVSSALAGALAALTRGIVRRPSDIHDGQGECHE